MAVKLLKCKFYSTMSILHHTAESALNLRCEFPIAAVTQQDYI
jgi:hypothetical protein